MSEFSMPKLTPEELEEKRAAFEEAPEYFLDCRKTLLVVDKKELEPGKTAYAVIPNLRSVADCMMVKGHVDEICDMTLAGIRMERAKQKQSSILVPGQNGHAPFRNFLRKK